MSEGYSLISSVLGHENEAIYSGIVIIGVISLVALKAKSSLEEAKDPVIPDDKLSFRSFGELIAGFILNLGDSVMGVHNRKYLPFVGSVFFYILFLNLFGLIPGFHGPTGGSMEKNLMFNLGIALVVFLAYHFWGIKEVGIVNYVKHFFGSPELLKFPLIFIGLFICVVEVVSHFVRMLSLSMRLYGNITGDHLVLGSFTEMAPLLVPVIFYLMGFFVACMQAFVFSILTMIYISFATAHEEHEESS